MPKRNWAEDSADMGDGTTARFDAAARRAAERAQAENAEIKDEKKDDNDLDFREELKKAA